MFRKLIGLLILVTAIVGMALAAAVGYFGWQMVGAVDGQVGGALSAADSAFESAETALISIQTTIDDTNGTLSTLETSAVNLAQAITATEPLLDQVQLVIGEELPASLETIDEAMPSLIEVADSIDSTLSALDRLSVEQSIPLGTLDAPDIEIGGLVIPLPSFDLPDVPLNFDLGVDYDPEMAFDEAIIAIDLSLDGVPESLRSTGSEIAVTTENLDIVGNDVAALADNLAQVNTSLGSLPAQLGDYVGALDDAQTGLERSAATLTSRLDLIRWIVIGSAIWLGLAQLAPLYVGLKLLRQAPAA